MVPVVSTLVYLLCLFLRHTIANTEQSKVSIVHQKSIDDPKSKISDGLAQSDVVCSRLCLQNTQCLLGHYHPGTKNCSLYCSGTLFSNPTEEGMILVIESRKRNIDYCGGTCNSGGVVDFISFGPLYCENTRHGGGWTVFQRRFDGSLNFYRDWETYKHGFGDINGEYWLGLEKLHRLTSSGNYMMRVDLEDFENNKRYAVYSSFRVGNESTGYRLKIDVSGYSGDAGNSLIYSNYQEANFSTFDRDNDNWVDDCAERNKGGWWYLHCSNSNLNGLYRGGYYDATYPLYANGIAWYGWRRENYSLKATEMMIRRLDY